MLSRVAPTLERREGELGTAGAGAAGERFLRLANGELDRAYRLAGMLLGDQNEAEDATQDALMRAWQAAGSLRDPAGFQAWFDRILVNICRDRLRRRRRITFIPIDPEDTQADRRDLFRTVLDRDQVVGHGLLPPSGPASSTRRISLSPWWRRDLTVPTGQPSRSATASRVRSAQ